MDKLKTTRHILIIFKRSPHDKCQLSIQKESSKLVHQVKSYEVMHMKKYIQIENL